MFFRITICLILCSYTLCDDARALNSNAIDNKIPQNEKHIKFDRDYSNYVESHKHTLFGSKTPVYIAKRVNISETEAIVEYKSVEDPFRDLRKIEKQIVKHPAQTSREKFGGDLKREVNDETKSRRRRQVLDEGYKEYLEISGLKVPSGPIIKHFENFTYQSYYEKCRSRTSSELNAILNSTHPKTCDRTKILEDFKEKIKHPVDVVYPQIMVFVDYETYLAHDKNPWAIAKYVATFFHGLDLRFRAITKPQVRLNIAGIIIPDSSDVEVYTKCWDSVENVMFGDLALNALRKFFTPRSPLGWCHYDILFLFSHRDLKIVEDVAGVGLGGECHRHTSEDIPAVVVRDKGGFEGIITAAHELGHHFGADHDDLKHGEDCTERGSLMRDNSERGNTIEAWRLSTCNKRMIQNFLKSPKASCFWNKPDVGEPFLKVLPGKLINRDQQCQRALGMRGALHTQRNNCLELWCEDNNNELNGTVTKPASTWDPPAEGTKCGSNSICLDGECVIEPVEHEAYGLLGGLAQTVLDIFTHFV